MLQGSQQIVCSSNGLIKENQRNMKSIYRIEGNDNMQVLKDKEQIAAVPIKSPSQNVGLGRIPSTNAKLNVQGGQEAQVPPTVKDASNGEDKINLEAFFPWTKVGSFEKSGRGSPQTSNTKMVKAYIKERFFNDWYCNIGCLVGTCFFSWFLAYFGFCWWSLGLVFFFTASVYRTKSRRFNRNLRDDLKRITVHETLGDRLESIEWLNIVLSKFWVIYMPVLSQQVKDAVNPQLAGVAPGYGIDSLSLDEFTLGSKAPSVQSIKSYPKKGDGLIEMDWKFSFMPNDVSDMTKREVENKINPKISLGVSVGKGFVSKSLQVLVENINVAGEMRATFKFGDVFPNIKTVSVSLLEPPLIDFALKPVGGETLGLDIMSFLPGLKTFVKSMIDSNAGPMVYAPNHFDIDVEEIMQSQSSDASGVVVVTLHSAQGLKSSGSVNPFVELSIEKPVLAGDEPVRFEVKNNTKSPKWNETKPIMVNFLNQKLFLKCFNSGGAHKNSLIGEAEFDLNELYQQSEQNGLVLDLKNKSKNTGSLKFDVAWFPTIGSKKEYKSKGKERKKEREIKGNPDKEVKSSDGEKRFVGTVGAGIDSDHHEHDDHDDDYDDDDDHDEQIEPDSGILKFTLHKVKYLSTSSSVTGILSPSAELYINNKKYKSYRTLRRMNEPSWEESSEILVPSRFNTEFNLRIYDEHMSGKELICEYSARVDEFLNASEEEEKFFKGDPQGEIYFTYVWKPVNVPENAFIDFNSPCDPLGAVRLHIRDVEVVDSLASVGDIDTYFSVTSDRTIIYKSNYYSKNSKPSFNSVIYIPITSENQIIALDLYDYQKIGKDRYIGGCYFKSGNLMNKDKKTGKYLPAGSDNKVLEWTLCDKVKKLTNNIVTVSVTFIPTILVYAPHELEKVEELEKKIAAKELKFEAEQRKLREEMEKYPDQYEIIEIETDDKDEAFLKRKEKMTLDELLQFNSGVIKFRASNGKLSKSNGFLQVLCDDFPFPVAVSNKSDSGMLPTEYGEYFVRDLRNSITCVRATNVQIVKDLKDVIAEKAISTLELLKKSYEEPTTITMKGSSVELQLTFYPSIGLPISETIVDTGMLELDIISAEGLPAADRNGLSDPYVTIRVDGTKLFTTETVKKTLNPVWNANTKVPIPSRARSQLIIEIYDWDRSGSNDLLCLTSLPLTSLLIDTLQPFKLDLEPQGIINLRTKFLPQYIRPAVNLSEGSFVSMPLKVVGTVAQFGVGAAAGAVSNVADLGISGIHKGGRLLKGIGSFNNKGKSDEKSKNRSDNSDDAVLDVKLEDSEPPNTVPRESILPSESVNSRKQDHSSFSQAVPGTATANEPQLLPDLASPQQTVSQTPAVSQVTPQNIRQTAAIPPSQPITQNIPQTASIPPSQPITQNIPQTASIPPSQPITQNIRQTASIPPSQPITQNIPQTASIPPSQPITQNIPQNASIPPSQPFFCQGDNLGHDFSFHASPDTPRVSVPSRPIQTKRTNSYVSRVSSFSTNIAPHNIMSFNVTIVAAKNLGKSVQVRLSLSRDGKIKHIYKTENRKADSNGTCIFNETCNFQAPAESNMILTAVSHHAFSKDTNIGVAKVSLSDPNLRQDGHIIINLQSGDIVFKLECHEPQLPPLANIPDLQKK